MKIKRLNTLATLYTIETNSGYLMRDQIEEIARATGIRHSFAPLDGFIVFDDIELTHEFLLALNPKGLSCGI